MTKPRKHAAKNPPARKPQHSHPTGRFNLDRRADLLRAAPAAIGHDDDLLTTAEVADWLRLSTQWLEIGRSRNYGPPFERLGPGLIRYRRASINGWLKEREFTHTAQYASRMKAEA